MIKEELESKYVIAHVFTEDLFKEDKGLLFNTKDEAKEYLIKHCVLYEFWWVCTVKDHNDLCLRWWGNGQTARSKMIDITEVIKEIKENDKETKSVF